MIEYDQPDADDSDGGIVVGERLDLFMCEYCGKLYLATEEAQACEFEDLENERVEDIIRKYPDDETQTRWKRLLMGLGKLAPMINKLIHGSRR